MQLSLNQEQLQKAIEIMQAYLKAPSNFEGQTLVEFEDELDRQRETVIENELQPLLSSYLSGQVALAEFKIKVNSINRRNELWGFNGIKGQMFFNMLVNVTDD